jgi:hypothetical protein
MTASLGNPTNYDPQKGLQFNGNAGLVLNNWSFDGDSTKPLVLLFDYIKTNNSGHGTAVDIRPSSNAYNFAFCYNTNDRSMNAIWPQAFTFLKNINLYVTNNTQYKNSGIYYNPSNSTLNKIIEGVIVNTQNVTTYPVTQNLKIQIGKPHYSGDRWYGWLRNVRIYLDDFCNDMLMY